MIARFVTDGADNGFCFLFGAVIDTKDTGAFGTVKKGRLCPVYKIRNTLLQQGAFNHCLTFRVEYLTQFYFIVDL